MKSRRFCSALSAFYVAFVSIGLLALPVFASAEPWWTSVKIEETRSFGSGLDYERILYTNLQNEPVRAHILSVSGVGTDYIFGVLGSFGVLTPPTTFAEQSDALAVINGGFFSKKPTRALGLTVAHNRVLYPPTSGGHIRGAVGFTPTDVLFDWIGLEDIEGHRFNSTKPGWNQCHAALGAGPILIKKGQSRVLTELEGYNKEKRAPRTVIAKTVGGLILLAVIDGRQPDWSAGLTLEELTEIFVARKASDALNLDGGGSSTMVVKGEILNRPSDLALPGAPGKERAVANVIALLEK